MGIKNIQKNNDNVAIELQKVSKSYKLYPSLVHQAIDVLKLPRLFSKKNSQYTEFKALDEVSLTINKGDRVGIIGRNGAGKTTLLKLVTGNFAATEGKIQVNGSIQALMQVGLGFHQEFSGYENIKSSLIYNGLSGKDFDDALNDIIDFVELEEFLNQPVKTYSLGMLSRLQFATATAIKPDILIVDEILGAGDAYFSGKSSDRIGKLAYSGATLLLVSHSTAQILQFCNRAIWIESGRVVMDSDAIEVVKRYEEFTQHLVHEAQSRSQIVDLDGHKSTLPKWVREKILKEIFSNNNEMSEVSSKGGVSRWPVERGLKICDVRVIDHNGQPSKELRTHSSLEIELEFVAEESTTFNYVAVIVLFTKDARYLCRHCSEIYTITLNEGEKSSVKLIYPENKLGNGSYVFSAALYKTLDLNNLSTARAYDLLSRSFEFNVIDKIEDDSTLFHHPAIWQTEVQTC
jgi:lipopolysaccharide transport system ATP-binding protein